MAAAAAVDILLSMRLVDRIGDLEKTISAVDTLLDEIKASQRPRVR